MSNIIHRASQRGVAEHGWLHSRFSFSFAEYYNPERIGYGALRVINDDIIEAGQGFPMHPHKEMEIISLVTKGSLEHSDSQGNHGVINEGEIQYMSAGSGVRHSEYNPSQSQSVELFQIWIYPNQKGGEPLYDQRDFNAIEQLNHWVVLASPDARDHSIKMRQDAFIFTTKLERGASIELPTLNDGNGHLLFVIEGSIEIAGDVLNKRDEIQITDKETDTIKALADTHLMLFEVPMHR
ncbi:pirin family protein [Sulfurimonas sp.]|uniref:pirin family protein n=1 Tax=Sulfurimonas sp. TaxID=2022749 RepID=UPI00356212DF